MARVTHVKKAQQRFVMVPILDENGQPQRTPVMRNGVQKTSKRGPVFITLTTPDTTKPLPNYKCDFCNKEIEVGTPYKHITPKSGPFGGHKRTRHAACPTWQVWDYSNSLSARIAQIVWNFEQAVSDATCADDFKSAQNDAAEEIRAIASEKEESAENIENGFGHETQMSTDLRDVAEQLNTWADEVEDCDVEEPEPQETDCDECQSTGSIEIDCSDCGGSGEVKCDSGEHECETCKGNGTVEDQCDGDCGGSGTYTPDNPTDEQISDWRDDTLGSHPINESPVWLCARCAKQSVWRRRSRGPWRPTATSRC